MSIPSRLFIRAPEQGKEERVPVVITSPAPFMGFAHSMRDEKTGKFDVHEFCPQEVSFGCPLCAKGDKAYFGLFLCCIEVRPYTYKDDRGNDRVSNFRKKTLCAKTGNHKFFDDLMGKHGTLRGAHLELVRQHDTKASIGIPEFKEMMTEDDMEKAFGSEEYSKDGVVVRAKNHNLIAYDYAADKPSVSALIEKFGGSPIPGSSAYQAMGGLDDEPVFKTPEFKPKSDPKPVITQADKTWDASEIPF